MRDRSLSPLSPETWPFSLELLPPNAYMVGGAVRDALLGRRREYLDLDFVVLDGAVKTARKIADRYKVGFVVLDAQRQIARVVFEGATADFAEAEGSSLEVDLQRRDFTMNAIAYDPRIGELIDPLGGNADLQLGSIRMVSLANLQDDPLRLLRGYRQAAQLGFVIESETQSAIRQLAPLLARVAAERVQTELGYLLGIPQGTSWLIAAWEDGLLQVWLPSAARLAQLADVERSALRVTETLPELGNLLSSLVGDAPKTTWLAIAKLACLLSPTPEASEAELLRLKYSRSEIRAVTTILRFLPQMGSTQMSVREQYFFFRGVGEVFPALTVLAVANGTMVEELSPLIERYLNPNDQVAHPTPLVSGNDLMKALNLPSSPQVGKLLNALGLARAEGQISTPTEALEFATNLLDNL